MLIKYILGSFFIALALSLPPLLVGAYGYDETADFCWYTRSYDVVLGGLYISPFKWATNYLPSILFIFYSTFASVRVMLRLKRAQRDSVQTNSTAHNSGSQSKNSHKSAAKTQRIVARLVSRLMFYPLVPLITNFFNIFGEVDYAIGHENKFSLLVPALVGTSIQGIITTTLFFTIDPAWTKLYIDIRKYYDPDFEQKQSSTGSTSGSVIDSSKIGVGSSGYYGNTYHNFEGPKYVNNSAMNADNSKEGVARFV
ncbi:hypothetical protein HK099_001172 [Clydaea vesicula]|uniref:Uncharacterized protein n=1 Tax=Clydaea vesicula TaxID=447962 RepID=A0AAD5TU18_9FUNG|nr:hypothetical protein HK099_001172 [Clydaea vesicula]